MTAPSPQALAGLRILDFSHVYQGPVGTQLLADYGADVIKVERPGSGDWSRAWGPFSKGVSLPFANLNRNKRSLAVNLKNEAGKEIVCRLIKHADVVAHNFRKGAMEKLGLGYDDMAAINPGIIYAWSSGWGDQGPYADSGRGGHDMMARAEGGWFIHYDATKPPIPGGMSIDYPAGLNLVIGILMALYHREKTGRGQLVSTDLLSVAFHGHAWEGAAELNAEKIDRHAAVGGTEAAIDKAFATEDGYIEISPVFSDNALRDLSLAMGMGDLSQDARFATEALQMRNRTQLNALLAATFTDKTTAQWMRQLEAGGVYCARVQSFRQAMDDPQIAANNMVVSMDHPQAGRLKLLGTPVRLHGSPPSLRQAPPDLGEHSIEIATELGYRVDEIQELLDNGVLGNGSSAEAGPKNTQPKPVSAPAKGNR
jgi:crotonobetainyl-CoA:carnitine CoA-transferase CaiB-like acyl-CoA transferase